MCVVGGVGRVGVMARQDYFTHFEPSQSLGGRKREIPEKNHLTKFCLFVCVEA